ncbi:MAG: hypothetical protein AAFR07_15730 [Pseudomonadota bacterium]
MSLFSELARRNVVQVGLAYIVIGWVIAQVAEFAFENFGAPEWVLKSFVVVLLLGLPLALFFAWTFEITPDGIKRDSEIENPSANPVMRRRLDHAIIGALLIAVAFLVWEREPHSEDLDPTSVKQVAVSQGTEGPISPINEPAESATVAALPKSIAVLPFIDLSGREDQEWFADGLTEEILNALARTPDLLVAARTSSFPFKGSTKGVKEIALSLGVAHVLEGSVRRSDAQLRVTAQLVRASDGFQLWSQTYDREPDDVIAIQEAIALEIATALETAMDPEALQRMLSAGTDSVPAYNAYLAGLAANANLISTGDIYSFQRGRENFEKAIALDPEFAPAYQSLADFWGIQLQQTNIVATGLGLDRESLSQKFNDAIESAIKYERDPVTQLQYRAIQATQQKRYPLALRLNTQFLEQRPNNKRAHQTQLDLLVDLSEDEALIEAIANFEERDGYDPLVNNLSLTYLMTSDDKEYIREFTRLALERNGDESFVQYQAHRILLWVGDIDGASRLLNLISSASLPDDARFMAALRQACAEGNTPDAVRYQKRLLQVDPENLSMLYISNMVLGQEKTAYEVLAQLDNEARLYELTDYLSYAYFDARRFPNLLAFLQSQGVDPRQPKPIPYQCSADEVRELVSVNS